MAEAVKTIHNIRSIAVQNSAEIVFNVVDENDNPVIEFEERNFDKDTLQVWTGTGGTGTQLLETTDFEFTRENVGASAKVNKSIYNGISITNATYQGVDLYIPSGTLDLYGDVTDETDINRLQSQISEILAGTAGAGVGSIHRYATYKDRSAAGLLPFAFDNAISQANYPALFAEVGHSFNAQHVEAGDTDLSASSTLFYPTPVPGKYGRVAIPDMVVTFANTSGAYRPYSSKIKDSFRDGTPFRFVVDSGTIPTGLTDGTVYYLRFSALEYALLFPTEADAIANTNEITPSNAGSGTFRLTQEGVAIDDAVEEHEHYAPRNSSTSPSISGGNLTGFLKSTVMDQNDATVIEGVASANVSNETRGTTFYEFAYIKAEDVTPSGETISALRHQETITGSTWNAQNFTVNLPFSSPTKDLTIKAEIKRDGVFDWQELDLVLDGAVAGTYGLAKVDTGSLTSFVIRTGSVGMLGLDATGNRTALGDGNSGGLRITVSKPNLTAVAFDVSAMPKTYDISAGNVQVTFPEHTGAPIERTYFVTGGNGTTNFSVIDPSTGLALDHKVEGEGHMKVVSTGSACKVVEYEDVIGSIGAWVDVVKGISGKYLSGTYVEYGDNITEATLWAELSRVIKNPGDRVLCSGSVVFVSAIYEVTLAIYASAIQINLYTLVSGSRTTVTVQSDGTSGLWGDTNKTSLTFNLTGVSWK